VTGANSGIGEAVAIALGQAGAEIVVNYVTGEDRAEAVAEEIRRSDVRAFAHKADVSEEQQVQEMFRRAIAGRSGGGGDPPFGCPGFRSQGGRLRSSTTRWCITPRHLPSAPPILRRS
jgi:NAD(P)-dependent dehydrogenase (short-subunit alcohol dehydrogenase family)